jgi:hypothetical protein
MNDSVGLGPQKDPRESCRVADVGFDKLRSSVPQDLLKIRLLQLTGAGRIEVVQTADSASPQLDALAEMRADKSRGAGDQNFQKTWPDLRSVWS